VASPDLQARPLVVELLAYTYTALIWRAARSSLLRQNRSQSSRCAAPTAADVGRSLLVFKGHVRAIVSANAPDNVFRREAARPKWT